MHPDEEEAPAEALATGIEETKLVLAHKVQFRETDLAPWTGIHLSEVMEFYLSG